MPEPSLCESFLRWGSASCCAAPHRCCLRRDGATRIWRQDSEDCTLFSDLLLPGGTVARSSAVPKTKPAGPSVAAQSPSASSLDRLIHERMRLGIISALAVNDGLTFSDLK